MRKLSKVYHYIRCIPKSILFNFYYLPFKQAITFPIIVSHRTKFMNMGGKVTVPPNAKTAKIKLGFGDVQIADSRYSRFIWNIEKLGVVVFCNNVKIGTGCKLFISGELRIGSHVNFSGESSITCRKRIDIGDNSLVSWGTIFSDTDFHVIQDNNGVYLNPDKEISIGKHVWVCSKATILKGVAIGDNTIVSASAHVVSSFEGNTIIGGNPAKVIGSMENKKFGK